MSRKRRVKRQWTNPVILVPIIAAIITAIIGPNVGAISQYIQDLLTQKPPEDGEPPINDQSGLSVRTDKSIYDDGDTVGVSGVLEEPVQGKIVRLDVYDPKGNIFQPYNESYTAGAQEDWTPAYPLLSDVPVIPDDKGVFSYRFPLTTPTTGLFEKGTYRIEVIYDGVTRNTTFTVL